MHTTRKQIVLYERYSIYIVWFECKIGLRYKSKVVNKVIKCLKFLHTDIQCLISFYDEKD